MFGEIGSLDDAICRTLLSLNRKMSRVHLDVFGVRAIADDDRIASMGVIHRLLDRSVSVRHVDGRCGRAPDPGHEKEGEENEEQAHSSTITSHRVSKK